MPDDRTIEKAKESAGQAADAGVRIFRALSAGETPDLADAKILEAAGCWIRRAIAKEKL